MSLRKNELKIKWERKVFQEMDCMKQTVFACGHPFFMVGNDPNDPNDDDPNGQN